MKQQYKYLMPRVSLTDGGNSDIIIVAPHGNDDTNTDVLAETIIQELGCYGVINNGWSRKTHNCNNINLKGAAKKEFLNPLVDFANTIINNGSLPHIFIIHGVSDNIRSIAPDLDFIIGYGAGNPPRLTCSNTYKDNFMQLLKDYFYNPYQGKASGNYSGWHQDNLNQLFVKNQSVVSIQIEIVRALRHNDATSKCTGIELSKCIKSLVVGFSAPSNHIFPEI